MTQGAKLTIGINFLVASYIKAIFLPSLMDKFWMHCVNTRDSKIRYKLKFCHCKVNFIHMSISKVLIYQTL
jgi:hypothetical protein